jgi:hypothetical protein
MRTGQVETYIVDPNQPDGIPELDGEHFRTSLIGTSYQKYMPKNGHMVIKLFAQTEDEAGGCAENRKVFLKDLEGWPYTINGMFAGHYENVGTCDKSPREYARWTILLEDPGSTPDIFEGDWDYTAMQDYYRRNG